VNDDDILLFIQTTVRTITLWTMMTDYIVDDDEYRMHDDDHKQYDFLSHFRILGLLWTLSVSLVDVEL